MSIPVDFKNKQLYLLEVLVKTVEIESDQSKTDPERPLFVRVKFLDFPHLEITRRDFLKPIEKKCNRNRLEASESVDANSIDYDAIGSRDHDSKFAADESGVAASEGVAPALAEDAPPEDPSTFNIGKSCMFPMLPLQLIKSIQRYPLGIKIFRKNLENEFDLVGGARVRLGPDFEDLIIEAGEDNTHLPVSNILESELPVKDIFGVPIGKMSIFIRLSCYGVTIVNQFQLIGENGEYIFKNDKTDNTLQAQRRRSFVVGNEPYATASVLGRLVHQTDVHILKPIVTTEENIHPLKGCDPFQEGDYLDSAASPWKNHSERMRFVNRAGEFQQSPHNPNWLQTKITPGNVDENVGNVDSETAAWIEALLKFKDAWPENDSAREGQKTTCCDSCCDHKKNDVKDDKNYVVKPPYGNNESQNAIALLKSIPDNIAEAIGMEKFSGISHCFKGHIKDDCSKRKDFGTKCQLPDNVPYTAGNFQVSNLNNYNPPPVDRNAFKGKNDEKCFFANMHKSQKSPDTTPNIVSSSPCKVNGNGNIKDCSNIAGKNVGVPGLEKEVDTNYLTPITKETNQIEKQADVEVPESQIIEKTLEKKLDNSTKADQLGYNAIEERAIKDLEMANMNNFNKAQVKSDSELMKSTRVKPKRKDSAELFKETLREKKLHKEERKPDSQSNRMRKKYLSIYKYTDGMYPGINVGHRHCSSRSKNVPKSMGWLWNLSDSGDGLRQRRGWKPGAINKTIANRIKMTKVAAGIEVEVKVEQPKGPKTVRKGRRPITAGTGATSTNETMDDDDYYDTSPLPPTLHVHKKDGVYFISMNPLRLEDDDDEKVPLMFKIDADPSTSSSESSLEIECTAPGALRRRQIKPPPTCQDKQTATEDA